MRKGLLSVLALCMSFAVMGQAQLDLQSRATLRAMRGVENGKQKPAKLPASLLMPLDNSTSTTGESCQMVGAMVRVKEGTTREQLEAEG